MTRTVTSLVLASILASAANGQVTRRSEIGVNPNDLRAGRVLWLRAAQGVEQGFSGLVSGWSGRSLSVSQGNGSLQPRADRFGMNGRPALRFDGNDGLVRPDGMPVGDYTKVVVVQLDDYNSFNNVLSGGAAGGVQHALFYGLSDRAMIFHSGSFVVSSVPTPLGEPTILVATYDSASGEGRLYQNGAFVGSGFAAPHDDPTLQVGSFGFYGSFAGSISEAMVYDRVIRDEVRDELTQILAARYRRESAPTFLLSEAPRPGAIVARGVDDQAEVDLAGTVSALGWPEIELRVRRDGVVVDTQSQALTDPLNPSPFSFTITLDAGLYDYDLELALRDGPLRRRFHQIRNVACGDLLMVNGQSNAVAADYWAEDLGNDLQSHWIRSFGTDVLDASVSFDLHWDLADAESAHAHASIGAWAMRIAELLVAEHQLPIGILNGAVGGTLVAQHQRNDANPTDPDTIYGRLLIRSLAAEVAQDFRAVLWYQGESDYLSDAATWTAGFDALRADWAEDYPNVEKIFVCQVRKGCSVSPDGVREAQRALADDPDIAVMSTAGVPDHDGCHFFYAGYDVLGERMHRLVNRDLYGSTDTHEIDPPNLDFAEWVDASQTAVRLTFRDPDDSLAWEVGTEPFFLLSDGSTVTSGAVLGNTVVLQLATASAAATISYDGHIGNGPFLRNGRQVGALTFFDVPIQ